MGTKTAISRRWVVFFQQLINMEICSLNLISPGKSSEGVNLRKLILANHLSSATKAVDRANSSLGIISSATDEDNGTLDDLSVNSDP